MGGVIDAGYRGEYLIGMINLGEKDYTFEKHHKIAQILIQKVEHPELFEVDELTDTERGEGAFGSTGTK
jgi:dUTP pyrophosphatase